jgi:glycosyltransferase involved in cell wall biosynthesis
MAIRVLHCIHHLQGGGAEKQLQLLANASAASGMEAGIFCVNDEGRENFSSSVRISVGRRSRKFDIGLFREVKNAINQFRPDIVHAWLPEVITIPSLLIAGLNGIPAVFSYRWAMHWHRPLTVVEFLSATIFSSAIISNHPVAQDRPLYRWLFKRKDGVTIPNGIAICDARFTPLVEPIPSTSLHILFAGRLTHIKNWDCLLQAIAILRSKRPCRLTICGEGEDRPRILARASELGVGGLVELLGFHSQLHSIMRMADMLVLPSWSEGMSNVFFEALANGLPCIVSDIPSHREIVKAHGCAVLFNPNSPQDLSSTIEHIAQSSAVRQKLRNAGMSTIQHYSTDSMIEGHRAVYRRLLE